jgi:hypothetical protein
LIGVLLAITINFCWLQAMTIGVTQSDTPLAIQLVLPILSVVHLSNNSTQSGLLSGVNKNDITLERDGSPPSIIPLSKIDRKKWVTFDPTKSISHHCIGCDRKIRGDRKLIKTGRTPAFAIQNFTIKNAAKGEVEVLANKNKNLIAIAKDCLESRCLVEHIKFDLKKKQMVISYSSYSFDD